MVANLLRYRRFEICAYPNPVNEQDDLWQFTIYGEENTQLLLSEMFPSATIALAECASLIQGIENAKRFLETFG